MAVGEALIDFIAPDAPDLASATTFIRAAGGAPANVSVAASRLGASAALVSAVGDDPFGAYLTAQLAENGVALTALRTVPERTTLAFVARNSGGIPNFLFYRGADVTLQPQDVPAELLARARFLYLGSMALLTEPSATATRHAAAAARGAGALVIVDPNLRPSSWPSLGAARQAVLPLLDRADIVKVNDEEARLLTGRSELESALGALGRPESLIVMTLGAEGCLWSWKGHMRRTGAPAVEVVETTGAGDAFVGGLLAALSARGCTAATFAQLTLPQLEAAVRFACTAGALACTRQGAMPSLPTRTEVEALDT